MSVAAPQLMIDGHDSAKFQESHKVDPAIPFNSEGGWLISRARFTRRPPVVYTLGFTDLSEAEKDVIQTLYNDARGSSEIITGWVHPTSGQTLSVRFKQGSVPQYTYRGMRNNHRWDISGFMIEEV